MAKARRQTLGDNVIPLNYALNFEPDMKAFKYRCDERISVLIKRKTREIKINSMLCRIRSATVSSGRLVQNARVSENKKLEQVTLSFSKPVSGNAKINIRFDGENRDKLNGFYRSKYRIGGKEHYMLSTQFEAADARKAFPCFDEPTFKATFDLSFTVDRDLNVISNMPEKDAITRGGKKLIIFERTPKMPPYLLYFGVGSFEMLKGRYRDVELNVVTVPGKAVMGGIALEYGRRFMEYYEDYFNIRYPLPKMDFIAVPDFAISGMENWGAITYSELALLADKKSATVLGKQRIAEVVAHELAHQWFGDLVTMKWWDDLWLNESFATFMSYKAMQKVYPGWQMDVQYVLTNTADALGADQLRSTQQIAVEVNSPGDMSEAFDSSITYHKGGAVLAMLEDYVGKDVFRKGLHAYLKRYSYSNATKHDLWREIGKCMKGNASVSKFAKVAGAWVNMPGYPFVDVGYSDGVLKLKQRRFMLLDRNDASIWPVPIHYLKGSGGRHSDGLVLLDKKELKMKEKGLDYIKLNYRQKGFYRTKYDEHMVERLGMLIKKKRLSALDGWGIESDLYSFSRSCRIKVDSYLDFVERYCMDAGFPLDLSVSGHLNALCMVLSDNKRLHGRIKGINIRYHKRILKRLGWSRSPKESNATTMLRGAAIGSLGFQGDREVIGRARGLFDDFTSHKRKIEPDIRSPVYRINAWAGNARTYDKMVDLYKSERVPEEQIRFLAALGNFKDAPLVDMALKFAMSKDVRLQYVYVIPYLASNHDYGKSMIWKWTKHNWKRLMKMYERGPGGLDTFTDMLSVIDDKKRRDEVERFFRKSSNYRDDIKRSIQKSLEFMDINIRFKEFNTH